MVEVLVAIVVMMVGMLGLLEAINITYEANSKNHMRDEAIYVGEKYMNILRAKPFDSLSTSYTRISEPSRLRGGRGTFNVDMTTADLSTDSIAATKQLNVQVLWTYKGVTYQNSVVAPVSIIR